MRIEYCLTLEIERFEMPGYNGGYFDDPWKRIAQDFHVIILKKPIRDFENSVYTFTKTVEALVTRSSIGELFDAIEFFARHPGSSKELKQDLARAFEDCRAAYRLVSGRIVAVGSAQEARTFANAINDASVAGELAARHHLVSSAAELARGNWASSVRESIHAVESIALKLAPGATTLGAALTKLEQRTYVHRGLKSAFGTLYGFASDEEGVRHALVFKDTSSIDESDALFMLGACAAFCSYLLTKAANGAESSQEA
tara:strand:+ start:266 stop:1036 length:771 start_codon:yes stop_codon:yes gene_type:complete